MTPDPKHAACVSDAELLTLASPRPWYFDGWDIFTTGPTDYTGGHRLVVPLPKDATHAYGIVDTDKTPLTPMMVERDALAEALYGD